MKRHALSIRLPPYLHEALKKGAWSRQISINADITRRLEASLKRSGELSDDLQSKSDTRRDRRIDKAAADAVRSGGVKPGRGKPTKSRGRNRKV